VDVGWKLKVDNLYKIFGGSELEALEASRAGATRDEIHRNLGSVAAVAGISFSVREGEVFVVMGLSGSGKSTLVRCINRLITPSDGHVLMDGEEISTASEQRLRELRRTKIAMVFQHFALFPHKTVAGNVEYGLKVRGVPRSERRDRALKALDLVSLRKWADVPPSTLSGGMQQRVGLARALAVDPEVLLMDEPFGALDPLVRREMQNELLELQSRFHKTIVFITHDLNEALCLGDRIAIMKDGRFVQVATPLELVTAPVDDYVKAFAKDVDLGRFLTTEAVMRREPLTLRDSDLLHSLSELAPNVEQRCIYVVDNENRPVGLICGFAPHQGGTGVEGTLRSLMRRDFPTCVNLTPISDLYHLCATGLPIAVVDDEGFLQGVIDPLDVFAKLGGARSGDSGNDGEPPMALSTLRHLMPTSNGRMR
jgi:glycine betaine/proline transport system ATP-binding protein